MKRKWVKRVGWTLLTPILLFVILIVLLYVPPVQNLLRREVTAYASKSTGMDIRVRRIDLRFPLNLLVRGVEVIHSPDTLLSLESLNVKVRLIPLLKGTVVVDNVSLQQASVNTAHLIKEMRIRGVIGSFILRSDGVDLKKETALVNRAELSNTHVQLLMNDTITVAEDTTASSPVNWKIDLRRLKLENVSFSMLTLSDTARVAAHIGTATMKEGMIDLQRQFYGLKQLRLSEGSMRYDIGASEPGEGFDASHIAVRDLHIGLDSLLYQGRNMKAVVRELSMNERSGINVTSFTGEIFSNDSIIGVPRLKLLTPHSDISLSARTHWDLMNASAGGTVFARLKAYLGKEDIILFAGGLPESFKESYPFRPLMIQGGMEGDLKEVKLLPLTIDLPGAFSMKGEGFLTNWSDSLSRSGELDLDILTQKLDFLATLNGKPLDGSIAIPDSMKLKGKFELEGPQYRAGLHLQEGTGNIHLSGALNSSSEMYSARLKVDNFQLHHFLPKDSIYELSLSSDISGKGLDFSSYGSLAKVTLSVDTLHYSNYHLSNIHLDGNLKGALATAQITSDNDLLKMTADGAYNLARKYPDGELNVDVDRIDLYKLGIVPKPTKQETAFSFGAEFRKNQVLTRLVSGDMDIRLDALSGIQPFIHQTGEFVEVLKKQLDEKMLNHAELRQSLPTAVLSFSAGKENPLADYLEMKDIDFHEISVKASTAPDWGMNAIAAVHLLKVDTLQLDTIFFTVKQDTAQMDFKGGVINAPNNPQFSFAATLTGTVRNRDAELMVEYKNKQGQQGALLGVNVRPSTEGDGKGDGLIFRLIPEEPVVAFRKFHFKENSNWVYLHKNKRVYANVDMASDEGMAFRAHSVEEDTTSLQNINVEIHRIRLNELSDMLPYFPEITGLFSAEAHYIQSEKELQVSAEVFMNELAYERQPIGNISLGATWLPGEQGKQYLNGYLTHEQEEVMTIDGKLIPAGQGSDNVEVITQLARFPLRIANAFIPNQVVTLSGAMNGDLHITGQTDKPLVNGELVMDTAVVASRQYAARFRLDHRPIRLTDNRLDFDKLAIYTTGDNPFTIDGYIDFRDMKRPVASLNMFADNYLLLDADRTRESLVYGKVLADLRASVKGPLDGLVMRGNINLLGSTDVAYILTDSPLTVQDRLGSMVTFTSFRDTIEVKRKEVPSVSLGGLDMNMTVHIDPSVRLKVDLDLEGNDRIELEGGGDLSLKHTPQGDLNLTGRYTLTGGLMKYSLPVIAAKEFEIENGSYIDWVGDPRKPTLKFKATDRIRASVADGERGNSRMVNFDVSIIVKERLDRISFAFDVEAPDDATIQNQLAAMDSQERGKQALYIMVAKTYLGTGPIGSGARSGNLLNMGAAINSVLTSQINALMGNLKNASFSFGIEGHDDAEAGGKRTDYSFRYSHRFLNNRFRIVIGGKVSTGQNVENDAETFIDNLSLEYRLDPAGTRYVRLFYDKNYESILEGEITEAGVGMVFRKKLDKLSELFIFRRKKDRKSKNDTQ